MVGKYIKETNPMYNRITLKCDYCGKNILKIPSLINSKNYCSRRCQHNHQKSLLKGENNPNWGNGDKISGSKNGRARKIICINTGEIFDCMKRGAEKYNTKNNYIGSCCRGRQKSAGKLENGQPLRWMFLEDYKKYIIK